ncbi:MAG: metallophosphoesterase [Bacteroidota bacterium]
MGFASKLTAQDKKPVIAFTSDTQEPMWIEKLFLKQNHNLKATRMIFKDVDTLRPSALFILGDVVSLGKNNAAWSNIDKYIQQLRKDSIPVFATLGNHEVMFNTAKGTRNFQRRFPSYKPEGYAVIVDSVAIVLLNSNFGAMTVSEITAQDNWYKQELSLLDKDPAVKFVIVGCHHSPYTNSRVVNPSVAVQENFVEPFLHATKCVLFLSGHSHNYERFKMKGKYFLVIGGGGGLHQPLKANNDIIHDISADYKPAFHYLKISRAQEKLEVTSRKLKPDFSGFQDGFSFSISNPLH